jgi:hypothetical protein
VISPFACFASVKPKLLDPLLEYCDDGRGGGDRGDGSDL